MNYTALFVQPDKIISDSLGVSPFYITFSELLCLDEFRLEMYVSVPSPVVFCLAVK